MTLTLNRAHDSHVRVIATVVALVVLAGCASPPSPQESNGASNFDAQIRQAITSASEQGVSQAQMDSLELARKQGEVTFEQTKIAAQLAVECMTAGGVDADYVEVTIRGVELPQFYTQPDPDSADQDRIADECETREFDTISMVYQTQPSVEALRADFDAGRVAELIVCLSDADVSVDPAANWDEATEVASNAAADGNEIASKCLGAALAP